ncbi:unnamed protein product [Rhizophagus irregularis]|uniref:Uncharacterized protein n=1 Tax=Rhizophagus irregularis TaxID=588596 RepID=A0A915Z8T2_9GLOM|nr:unnamed protein product [Rhizophagus irregularis]CAB5367312.1 unnamed protein product [Rhizophagus irregularis]
MSIPSTRTLMDFYCEAAIEDWTCVNLAEYYHAWSGKKDLKVVMDYMKKDLQKVADYESNFEIMRKRKAREILDNWKNWSTSINNLKQDCARINVGNLRVKQVNQLAAGNVVTYNDIRIIPEKHRRDTIEEATILLKKDGLSSKRNQESDDDFQPSKTPSTKRRKQLSLSKKNKKLVELIASKKAKTTCRNVDERGNDDDPSLSNESSNSRSSTGSTPQIQRTS